VPESHVPHPSARAWSSHRHGFLRARSMTSFDNDPIV
jgi:hypothetical protein